MSFIPEKCAARVSPPTLVLFYKDANTGKRRRRSMPLRKFTEDVNVQKYAEKLCGNKKNGQYIKLIPLQQLESVLGKIKLAKTGQDKSLPRLDPLELPTPVSKRGRLQPLTPSTAKSLEDDYTTDKLLVKSNDSNGLKPVHSKDVNKTNKESDKLSTSYPKGLNDAISNQSNITDMLLRKHGDPLGDDKATAKSEENSLQLSSASIPSEITEGEEDEDFENMTEEGILEKLIALPSNSDEENDLNKVNDNILKQKKKEMDKLFEENQLKPGDPGYEYDKEIDFDGDDKVSCGWDSSANSDIEYF